MTQALGMAPGLSNLVMYVGSSDAAFFNAMATARPLSAQLSSSWAWSPPEDRQAVLCTACYLLDDIAANCKERSEDIRALS
jgi:hypothetical protein